MKDIEIKAKLHACQMHELSMEDQELVQIAKAQTKNSYCPYSKFHVGAAAKLENGIIIRGANQENAAYPSGLCAERSALFAAGANYPDVPVSTLVIACFTDGRFTDDPGAPCGACRQVMIETEHRYGKPMKVILYGEKEIFVFDNAADLMPVGFFSESLSI
jgi:cytidine deaminase